MASETLFETEPRIKKADLLLALVAAVRWKAAYDEVYVGDEKHLTIISQVMEKLTESLLN